MACVQIVSRLKGSSCHLLLVIALWLRSYLHVVALPLFPKPGQTPSTSELPSSPNSATFQPIDISPTMIPQYPFPGESLPPMYPSLPKTYDPVLTGRCPDISTFEKAVNTSKLLESCSTVDPLKECCGPVCQPAISEAALQISGIKTTLSDNKNIVGAPSEIDTLNDCKGVVYSWITRKLRFEDTNTAFRLLSSCKVNKGKSSRSTLHEHLGMCIACIFINLCCLNSAVLSPNPSRHETDVDADASAVFDSVK
ncbi:putative protein NLP8-like [Capsicum annuum]|nr:putative protein NLP8-like [Capsicum annuum]